MDDFNTEQRDLIGSYDILIRDLQAVFEYIEPTDTNERTYSHRLYALYLRAATEFESLCKSYLVSTGYVKSGTKRNGAAFTSDDWTIVDYRKIYTDKELQKYQVGVLIWQPDIKYITPFSDWQGDNTLSWYRAYNEVKHNRQTKFSNASLLNVLSCLAGLFLLIYRIHGRHIFNPTSANKSARARSHSSSQTEYIDKSIFNIRQLHNA
jgi:hypothetical protein